MAFGKLFMIPCPIVEGKIHTIPSDTLDGIRNLDHFIVERAKTARRFIKTCDHPKAIAELNIFELDKNNPEDGLYAFLENLKKGISVGVISEAGCPGIADPGALAVKWCHQQKVEVTPLVGPSSILLALMASGFSGQQFCFHGYLPVKKPELIQQLKRLEADCRKFQQSQIFMETPYRNNGLLETMSKALHPKTKLCVASNINDENAFIKTLRIEDWKSNKVDIHKKPTIFIIGN